MTPVDDGSARWAADVALRAACETAGLDATGAGLLSLGSNAVYRLRAAPAIVRIACGPEDLPSMERAVAAARWLEREKLPATRVLPGVPQPALIEGRVVTYWQSAQDEEAYARTDELADLLRRLHGLTRPASLRLPRFDPFAKVRDGLLRLDGLAAQDRAFLQRRAERLHGEYRNLNFVLPLGITHGDANVGNTLRDRTGRAVLIDLDGFSLAPREWDLVLTALYYERFGWHTRSEYESSVHHYGYDLMRWPGYSVLADIRELLMTLWLGRRASTNATSAEEFIHRVKSIRSNASRQCWKPF